MVSVVSVHLNLQRWWEVVHRPFTRLRLLWSYQYNVVYGLSTFIVLNVFFTKKTFTKKVKWFRRCTRSSSGPRNLRRPSPLLHRDVGCKRGWTIYRRKNLFFLFFFFSCYLFPLWHPDTVSLIRRRLVRISWSKPKDPTSSRKNLPGHCVSHTGRCWE